MSCIKERKFLFLKWQEVKHDYRFWKLSKFMSCSNDFELTCKCEHCNHLKKISFVKYDDLLLTGFSSGFLNNIGTDGYFFKEDEQWYLSETKWQF